MSGDAALQLLPRENEADTDFIPDEALTEIQEHCPKLDDKQRRYVYWRIIGVPPTVAFARAGYAGSSWKFVESGEKVREAIKTMLEATEIEHNVTQKTVVGILMEAIDVARQKNQAGNMIEGAKALSDILGITAAQKIQINQQSTVSHTHEVKTVQQLDKTQLERLLEIDRMLTQIPQLPIATIIEGEFEETFD